MEGEVATNCFGFLGGSCLVVIQIHVAGWGHDDVLSEVGGGDSAASSAPAHNGGSFGESAFEDFIPADEPATVLVEVIFHLLDEPGLEFVFIFKSTFFDAGLFSGVVFPLGFGAFIASDVDEFAGEDRHNFGEDIAAELDGFGFSVEDSVADAPSVEDFGGFAVSEFGVGGDGGDHVSWHIDFGHDGDMPIGSVSDNFAEVFLGVVAAVGDVIVIGGVVADHGIFAN